MRRTHTAVAWIALGAAMVLMLAGCSKGATGGTGSSTGTTDTKPYIVVNSAAPDAQGVLAGQSQTSIAAAEAAAADINNHGGINGRKIKLVEVNDNGDPTTAVTVLQAEMAKEHVDLYINAGPGTVGAAVGPILNQAGILYVATAPYQGSGDPKLNPLTFNVSIVAQDMIKGFAAEIKKKGYKRVALINGNSATSGLFADAAKTGFAAEGIDLVGDQVYDVAALDMTAQLSTLRDLHPDVLVMNGYGAPVGYLLQSIQKLGWDIPILGDISVSATSLTSTAPPTGVVGTSEAKNLTMLVFKSTVYDPKDTRTNAFIAALKKHGGIGSSIINGWTWDSLQLVAAAAKKAGSSDPKAIAKALESGAAIDKVANTAIVDSRNYSATSHTPSASPSIFEFTKPSLLFDGQFGNPAAK